MTRREFLQLAFVAAASLVLPACEPSTETVPPIPPQPKSGEDSTSGPEPQQVPSPSPAVETTPQATVTPTYDEIIKDLQASLDSSDRLEEVSPRYSRDNSCITWTPQSTPPPNFEAGFIKDQSYQIEWSDVEQNPELATRIATEMLSAFSLTPELNPFQDNLTDDQKKGLYEKIGSFEITFKGGRKVSFKDIIRIAATLAPGFAVGMAWGGDVTIQKDLNCQSAYEGFAYLSAHFISKLANWWFMPDHGNLLGNHPRISYNNRSHVGWKELADMLYFDCESKYEVKYAEDGIYVREKPRYFTIDGVLCVVLIVAGVAIIIFGILTLQPYTVVVGGAMATGGM